MEKKPRKTFTIWGRHGEYIGNGVYYPYGGNVQVYLKAHNFAAWQIASISDVLLLNDVTSFQWEC